MSEIVSPVPVSESEWGFPPLDRSSPLPLYAQIKQRLIGILQRWENADRRFYSDEQLCALFGVSRDTARQAVSALVQEGLLVRNRGLGTFVAMHKLEEHFSPGMDFQGQWAATGTPMQSTLLVFERQPADDTVAAALEIPAGTEALFIKRVRSGAGVPIAIDHRHLPADLVADWTEETAAGSPLHRLWQSVDLKTGDFTIEAGLAGPEEVEYLHLNPGAPVLIRSLRYRDQTGRLVLAGHTVHRADLVRYSLSVPLSRDGGGAVREGAFDRSGVHED